MRGAYMDRLSTTTKSAVAAMSAVLLTGLFLAGCVTEPSSGAGGGNWLRKNAALSEGRKMNAKGMKPASIDCRSDSASNADANFSTKIEWKPNKPWVHYQWFVGGTSYVASEQAKARKAGLHKVSSKKIYSSGVSGSCELWES
jgi:hypothetical protein